MFNGIEIDMLSLGDADCIVLTKWENSNPYRILIDGGSGDDAEITIPFLRWRGYTDFWVALCTHLHNDHARGLVKVVQNRHIKIRNGFMHDIRSHVAADALRRASVEDGVKEVLEATKELAGAFASRSIPVYEPFAGFELWPGVTVLGPTLPFYKAALEEFTKVDLLFPPRMASLASLLGGQPAAPYGFGSMFAAPVASSTVDLSSLLTGALGNSSVKEDPKTQPFNNTSVILGVAFNGARLLFTADAGSDALDSIPADWKNLTWMQVPHHGSDGNLSQKNIERFCPRFAYISACGDSSHPSRAIVNGLMKVRADAEVFSTHTGHPKHLWFHLGDVPARSDYEPAVPLNATGDMKPFDWTSIFLGS